MLVHFKFFLLLIHSLTNSIMCFFNLHWCADIPWTQMDSILKNFNYTKRSTSYFSEIHARYAIVFLMWSYLLLLHVHKHSASWLQSHLAYTDLLRWFLFSPNFCSVRTPPPCSTTTAMASVLMMCMIRPCMLVSTALKLWSQLSLWSPYLYLILQKV